MGAIAGICNWDGRPTSSNQLTALASQSRILGSDDGRTVIPRVGLAFQAFPLRFDHFASIERQPRIFARDSVLAWDGRLDNRDDLRFALHRELKRDITDSAIVAAAFERWGLDCLRRLIGDWSLAIWDAATERVVLARDAIGNRPLYYLVGQQELAWGTSLDALATCFHLYSQPDEAYIAMRLGLGVNYELTPYRGVRALQAGHLLVSTRSRVVDVRRYWTFEPSEIRYARLDDYDDQLSALLNESVRVRLRAHGTVWAHSSGGWDSSAIVCIAHRLIEHSAVEATSLRTLTQMWPLPFVHAEDEFVRAVECATGISTLREIFEELPTFEERLGVLHPLAIPERARLERHIIAAGDSILLSGQLGNEAMLLSGGNISLFEALSTGHPISFLKLCLRRAKHMRRPFLTTLTLLAREILLAKDLRARSDQPRPFAERQRRPAVDSKDLDAPGFGVSEQMWDIGRQMIIAPEAPLQDFPIVKRRLIRNLYRSSTNGLLLSPDYVPHVWFTFPFSHRPLLEFVIGAPQLAMWDPVISRAGMRRSLANVLPSEFLNRTTKGDISPALARLTTHWVDCLRRSDLFLSSPSSWELVSRGYLEPASVAQALAVWQNDPNGARSVKAEWIGLEAWLRTLAGRTPEPRRLRGTSDSIDEVPPAVGTEMGVQCRP